MTRHTRRSSSMTHTTHTPAANSREANPADPGLAAAVKNDELLEAMAKLRAGLATIQQEAAQVEASSQAQAQWVVASRQAMTALEVGLKDAQALMDLQTALTAPGGRQAMALEGIASVLENAAKELLPKAEKQTLEEAINHITSKVRETVAQAIGQDAALLGSDQPLIKTIVALDQSTENIDQEATLKLDAAEQEMKAAALNSEAARKKAERALAALENFVKGLKARASTSLNHQKALISALGDRLVVGAAPQPPLDPGLAEAAVIAYVELVLALDGLGANKVQAEQQRLIQQAEQAEQEATDALAVLLEKQLTLAEARRSLEKKKGEKAAQQVLRAPRMRDSIQRMLQGQPPATAPTPPAHEGDPAPTEGGPPESNPG
jgi:hypothetical protein